MPYPPSMYTPDSSSSDGSMPMLTPPSASPQSTWQSPGPDSLGHGGGLAWNTDDFDFGDALGNSLSTSMLHPQQMVAHDPTSHPREDKAAMTNFDSLNMQSSSSNCNFLGNQDDSGYATMSEFGLDAGDGLEGVLQRQLDEQAPMFVY